jgi:hypothetical protein
LIFLAAVKLRNSNHLSKNERRRKNAKMKECNIFAYLQNFHDIVLTKKIAEKFEKLLL